MFNMGDEVKLNEKLLKEMEIKGVFNLNSYHEKFAEPTLSKIYTVDKVKMAKEPLCSEKPSVVEGLDQLVIDEVIEIQKVHLTGFPQNRWFAASWFVKAS